MLNSSKIPLNLANKINVFKKVIESFIKPQYLMHKTSATHSYSHIKDEEKDIAQTPTNVFIEQLLDKIIAAANDYLLELKKIDSASPEAFQKFSALEKLITELKELHSNKDIVNADEDSAILSEISAAMENEFNALNKNIAEIEKMSVNLLKIRLKSFTEQGIRFVFIHKIIKEIEKDTSNLPKNALAHLAIVVDLYSKLPQLARDYLGQIPMDSHIAYVDSLLNNTDKLTDYLRLLPDDIAAVPKIAELKMTWVKDITPPVQAEADNKPIKENERIVVTQKATVTDTEDDISSVPKEEEGPTLEKFKTEIMKAGLSPSDVNSIISQISPSMESEFNTFWPKLIQAHLNTTQTKTILQAWKEGLLPTETAEEILTNKDLEKIKSVNNGLTAYNNSKILSKYGIITEEQAKISICEAIASFNRSQVLADLYSAIIKNLNSLQNFLKDATIVLRPLCQNIINVKPALAKEPVEKIFQTVKMTRDINQAEAALTKIIINKMGFSDNDANAIFDEVTDKAELRSLCQNIISLGSPLSQKQIKRIFETIRTTKDVIRGKDLLAILVDLKNTGMDDYSVTEIFSGIVPILNNFPDSRFRNLLIEKILNFKIDHDQMIYNNFLDTLIPVLKTNTMNSIIEEKLPDISDKAGFFSLMNIVISFNKAIVSEILTDEEACEILTIGKIDEEVEKIYNNINIAVSEGIIDSQEEGRLTETPKHAKSIFFNPHSNDARALNNTLSAFGVGKQLIAMGFLTNDELKKSLKGVVEDNSQAYGLMLYYKGLLWAQRSVINIEAKDELKALCKNINNLQPRLTEEQIDNVLNTAITDGFSKAQTVMGINVTLKKIGLDDAEINSLLRAFIPVLKTGILDEAIKVRLTGLTKNQAVSFMGIASALDKIFPMKLLSAAEANDILANIKPDKEIQNIYKNIDRAMRAHIIEIKDAKHILKNPSPHNTEAFNNVVNNVLPIAEELLEKGLLTRIDFEASLKPAVEHLNQSNHLALLYTSLNNAFDAAETLLKKGLINAAYLKPFLISLNDNSKLDEFTDLCRIVNGTANLSKQQIKKIFETVISAKEVSKGQIVINIITNLKSCGLTDLDINEIIETCTPDKADSFAVLSNNLTQANLAKDKVKQIMKSPDSEEAKMYLDVPVEDTQEITN